MFSFFRKKPAPEPAPAAPPAALAPEDPAEPVSPGREGWGSRFARWARGEVEPPRPEVDAALVSPARGDGGEQTTAGALVDDAPPATHLRAPGEATIGATPAPIAPTFVDAPTPELPVAMSVATELPAPDRSAWFARLRSGLRKTGTNLAQVFTGGARIDDALYEELEAALLQADAGLTATELLLDDLRKRVKRAGAADAGTAKALLADAIADLLAPLERPLVVGEQVPTVIMVVGVNGAGKTTTIGKLTRHLVGAQQKVMLAAADTFRAAAREQLLVWADRAEPSASSGRVEIVSQEGGDPAGVTYDAVVAAKSRACDIVIADTAGRLTTQSHLMEELRKVRRVIGKAQAGAPHEVLLVIDGNTGQNALAQVQAFDAALELTGLVVTKLDGTAKGGALLAVALWARSRGKPLAVYFIGVGEKLEDLQTFSAREFAQALLS
jgi:fused signal recognition particle receptor